MSEVDHSRRRLINASGAALLSGTLAPAAASAQIAVPAPDRDAAADRADDPTAVSAATAAFADEVAGSLDRPLSAEVAARGKLHVLDTLAAIASGSRLKAGNLAGRYVESIGGKPQALVIGTNIVTSAVNAAMANAMAAHADETDDTNPIGPVHLGCGAVPAALATAELAGRSGDDFLRAVMLGYDVGARMVAALGIQQSRRNSPSCLMTTFVAAAAAAAVLRLDARQVRHTFSYAAQQASGIGSWTRDREHVEKAFDFAGMGARNGVMAATMVAFGFSAVEDPFSGTENIYTALADKAAPEKLLALPGTRHAVFGTTIKKWTVGAPLQSVLDSFAVLLDDPGLRADTVKRIRVEMPTGSMRIVDNSTSPDLCVQHLSALMVVDRGASFASVHDVARMSDPRVLAVRKLVELVPSEALQKATPPRQATVTIETTDGRILSHHTTVVRGTAGNPMDAGEIEAKALDLMAPVLGAAQAKELIAAVGELDRLGPIARLRPLLQA
ncbi:MAG TPA: MmgE/PrpD family protein [Xanthobacteraceae bacterium]|nr:MmgE/PrpD family protein [Xanthobacteraceae bacterium]